MIKVIIIIIIILCQITSYLHNFYLNTQLNKDHTTKTSRVYFSTKNNVRFFLFIQ